MHTPTCLQHPIQPVRLLPSIPTHKPGAIRERLGPEKQACAVMDSIGPFMASLTNSTERDKRYRRLVISLGNQWTAAISQALTINCQLSGRGRRVQIIGH